MADFPRSIPIHMESVEKTLDEFMVSRARSGRIRGRRLYASPVKEFRVVLRGLTNAQRDTVQNFLTANRKLPFGFFWPYGAGIFQVIWIDSEVAWKDLGGKLSATDLTFAVVT